MWAMPPEIRTTFHALRGRTMTMSLLNGSYPVHKCERKENLPELVFSAAEFFINIFSDVWMKQSENAKHFQRKKKVSGIEKI